MHLQNSHCLTIKFKIQNSNFLILEYVSSLPSAQLEYNFERKAEGQDRYQKSNIWKIWKKETSLPSLSAVSIAYVLIFIFVSYKQTNLSDLFNVKCSPLMVEPWHFICRTHSIDE